MSDKPTWIARANRGKDNPFFVMSRAVAQDKRLSWAGRGMMAYLLSKPDDWRVNVKDLQQGCGRDKVYSVLAELETFGYLTRENVVNSKKQFARTEYRLWEEPLPENPQKPLPEKPDTVLPDTVLPDTENTDAYIIEIPHKTESTKDRDNPLSQPAIAAAILAPSPVAIVDAVIDQGHDDLDTMVSKVTAALESPSIKEGLDSGQTPPPTPAPSPTGDKQSKTRQARATDPLFNAVAHHFFMGVGSDRVAMIVFGKPKQDFQGLIAFECAYQGKDKVTLDYGALAGLIAKFAADYRKDDPRRELKDCGKFMERWEGWRKNGGLLGSSRTDDFISDPIFRRNGGV